jgi:hypothetical protein
MTLLLSAAIVLLPLPLFAVVLRTGHYRRCPVPFLTVGGIYLFMLAGAPSVIANPLLYSDLYFYTLLLVIVGCYVLYAVVLALGPALEVDYSPLVVERSIRPALVLFLPLWAYSVAILALYISRHGPPPLFALFTAHGGYVNFYAVRAVKTTSIPEGTHWYLLGLQTVPYFIFIYSYALKRLLRTPAARGLFAVNAVLTVAFATSFANKDVVLNLALFLILVRLCLGGQGMRLRTIALIGLAGLASVFVFLRIYLLDRSSWAVLRLFGGYLVERLLLVYTEAHAYIVRIFPREHPFLDGLGFSNPGGLLPFTPIELNRYLGYRVMGHLANYAMPAVSHGYANFGLLGILFIMGVIILQVVLLQAIFRRLPKTTFFASLFVLLAARTIRYGSTAIENVMAEEVILFLLGVVVLHFAVRDVGSALARPAPVPAAEPR